MNENPEIVFSASREIEASIRCVDKGREAFFETYQRGGDEFIAPLLLVSQGLERLMKAIWIIYQRDTEDGLPRNPKHELQRTFGHDLNTMKEWIVANCYTEDIRTRPAVEDDYEHLTSDDLTQEFFGILSEFAQRGRYYHIDRMVGEEPEMENPNRRWEDFEDELLSGVEFESADDLGELTEQQDRFLAEEVGERIARITRAFCRLFTLGPLGETGQRFSGMLSDYLFIMDDDLSQSSTSGSSH